MSIKDDYYIRPISYADAKYYVENYHYLERASQMSYSFGVYEIDDGRLGDLVGVITYGKPASPSLCNSICGEEESGQVMELTRLWTKDSTPRNLESWFIANTIKRVQEDIIVSYADHSQGHAGYVYQATNWIYTGMGAGGTTWVIEGVNKHSRHLLDEYESIEEAKKDLGDRLKKEKVSKKHRYVFLNCNRRRKKYLKKELNYPVKEYPKLSDN